MALSAAASTLARLGYYEKLAGILGIIGLVLLFWQRTRQPFYPDLPLAGETPHRRWFSLRTRFRYYTDCASLFNEAYHTVRFHASTSSSSTLSRLNAHASQYTKHGKGVLLPSVGVHTAVVMPESALDWAMSQPDSALSITHAFADLNQTRYSLGDARYWRDPWQLTLVKAHLAAVTPALVPQLNDELADALAKRLGTDTDSWREMELETTLRRVVAQTLSRLIVGPELCRDEGYLDLAYKVVLGVMTTIFATLPYPDLVRAVTGPLASWHTQRRISRIQRHLEPLYRERLAILRSAKEDQPPDLLMAMMRFAQKKRPEELADPAIIARRVCAANFVAMHQTTIVLTNIILHVLGSDAEFSTIAALRSEAAAHLLSSERITKDAFAQMKVADSVAREATRLNFPLGGRASPRTVMRDGLVSPEGIRLQRGTTVSWLAGCAQLDPEAFPEPRRFDPFRFSRGDGDGEGERDTFVKTSARYLPWGHGKHACPGRFVVDYVVKMALAQLVTKYDLAWPEDYGGKQPPSVWLAELSVPPPRARIMVRRRKV
ncbi:Cytochrome P450 [Cordyceps fumosorosea ARSEF 2679]|uniref:Cytochrome P450 monooxygenase fumoB n=1 Tax=Cordyceps fumosorosea (strain ARSEF 2679) TaxID=1081104 RepID=FUMOB_CORFA|nr:Cytochrome P450 [Cordyceps fumosorosea ARSEF 2679]A0A167LUR6.1 RecName: Full=Cytochrome P450 monooxygenase fumoB; AltName: Full=Fumosorinone biosynthesis cluster protein B [Cordyceps fumosorosea ARSEF 2679]AKC54421.1 cytochrome P450 monooxygenase [Cordyceps fumosorosea]OAA53531.1 Cytochrome P450 [Cordyceps fumosorosea ARSEF 2679]